MAKMQAGDKVKYTEAFVAKCEPEKREAAKAERGTVLRVLFDGKAASVNWEGRGEQTCLAEFLEAVI